MNDNPTTMTRVLIIDDDEKLATLLTEFLGGFSFHLVASKGTAMGAARAGDTA